MLARVSVSSVFLCGALILRCGCGSGADPQSEDYGNLLASPGLCSATTTIDATPAPTARRGESCNGLIVLQREHPTGWTRPDCFGCHNVNNMHQVNRTGLPDEEVDLTVSAPSSRARARTAARTATATTG